MNLTIGDKVKYYFPNPINISKKCFVGIVDFIGDTFITLKDESNTKLKISFKNYHLLDPILLSAEKSFTVSENHFG